MTPAVSRWWELVLDLHTFSPACIEVTTLSHPNRDTDPHTASRHGI